MQDKNKKLAYKLNDVKDHFKKVARDIYRLKNDDDSSHLWQVDGDYIVALYEDEEETKKTASNPWEVELQNNEVNVFYKNEFVASFSPQKIGLASEDVTDLKFSLPKALKKNASLVNKLLNLNPATSSYILNKFPELKA